MIVDRLENIQVYFGDETMLSRALHFAKAFSPMQPDGKYEIEGSMIYALCKTYTTKPTREGTFENHKEYIDIQVILEGHEMMGHTLEADLVPQTAYNRDKDSQKYASPKAYNSLYMKPGYFVIFFPHDYHMPDCVIEQPTRTRKLVVKVKA